MVEFPPIRLNKLHFFFFFLCAFQDHRFSDEIDKLTGYKTQSILCLAICNSDGEVIGVVQAINKNPMGTPFSEDDEKVRLCRGEHKHCAPSSLLRQPGSH